VEQSERTRRRDLVHGTIVSTSSSRGPVEVAIDAISAQGNLITLYSFTNGTDGGFPSAAPIQGVSILSKAGGVRASLPVTFPSDAEWLMRVMASQGQFVFGMYRRHMKTIGYLGQIDKLYGVPATTRNWNTIVAILRILKSQKNTR
jgi:hypothetical protein